MSKYSKGPGGRAAKNAYAEPRKNAYADKARPRRSYDAQNTAAVKQRDQGLKRTAGCSWASGWREDVMR